MSSAAVVIGALRVNVFFSLYNLTFSRLIFSLVCSDGGCFVWVDILFVTLRLGQWPPTREMAVYMAAADDILAGD